LHQTRSLCTDARLAVVLTSCRWAHDACLRFLVDSINQLGLDGNDESSAPKNPVGAFGSFSATFADGMSVSFSVFGASGVPKLYKKYEPAPYVPAAPRSPSPAAAAASDKKEQSPAKKTKDKGAKDKSGAAATPEPPQPQVRAACARWRRPRTCRAYLAERWGECWQ